jgi:thiamine-monophosphate kinase
MKTKTITISEFGEFSLIDRLEEILPRAERSDLLVGIGDDCAVVKIEPDRALLLTCDIQVQDRHFQLENISSYQLGRRALAVNLSDIAAMGGQPLYALVSLGLPPHYPLADYEALFQGMRDELKSYNALIIGGNLAQTEKKLIIDITLIGEVHPDYYVERKGAREGDKIYITGQVGASAAGFYILQKYGIKHSQEFQSLVEAHLQPRPRIEIGQKLAQKKLVSAMIDVSDGIASDLYHICRMSGVGAEIELEAIPVPKQLQNVAQVCQQAEKNLILHSGEDYELLFTTRAEIQEAEIKDIGLEYGVPISCIGHIIPQSQGYLIIERDGQRNPLRPAGWDHFKSKTK